MDRLNHEDAKFAFTQVHKSSKEDWMCLLRYPKPTERLLRDSARVTVGLDCERKDDGESSTNDGNCLDETRPLRQPNKLKDVVVVGGTAARFDREIPHFYNLRLGLFGLRRHIYPGSVYNIVQVLLASPCLTSLGLSLARPQDVEDRHSQSMLKNLAYEYRRRSKRLRKQLSRVSGLHLGFGFIPEKMYLNGNADATKDYLAELADSQL